MDGSEQGGQSMTLESTIAGSWHPGPAQAIRAMADAWENLRDNTLPLGLAAN